MRTHDLKCWPAPFAAVLSGEKKHEIRVDDRGFAVGDVLHLREWDPTPIKVPITAWSTVMTDGWAGYTARSLRVRVTHLTPGGAWGLPANLCVMSIESIEPMREYSKETPDAR
jgi:hypothetical protein